MNWVTSLWAKPRLRAVFGVLAFALITLVTLRIGYWSIHTILREDEGYMLVVLKGFINHGSLYDDVFAQYGPFYYEFWGAIFSIFGIPVTQDAGRIVTLVIWVLIALGTGLVTLRATRSIFLGLAAQAMTFIALSVMIYEPMHPGGLICLLLVSIVLIASFVKREISIGAMALLGAALAALLLTKINVGIFALASVALVCAASYSVFTSRRWPRLILEIGFVALPILLMTSKFGEGWARHFGVHVSIAALALVIALRARTVERRPAEELGWLLGGLLAVGVAVCLAIIGSGTSLGGLIEGVVTQPLRQGDAFTLPLQLTGRAWLFDAVGLMAAIVYWHVTRRSDREPDQAWIAIASLFSIAVGVTLALSLIGKTLPADNIALPGYPFSLLAFTWVALVRLPGRSDPATDFVRLLLPALALLQPLHAFPVAGSQVIWGTFLLIPVGAVCVINGSRGLAHAFRAERERRALALFGAGAAVALALFVANATMREPLERTQASYNAAIPLDLPGSTAVRLSEPEVITYREITAAIDRDCGSFLTEPGMLAFYIWTQQDPPTGFNATAWMTLFDDAQQQRVIDDTRAIEGLCVLRNKVNAEEWSRGPVPPGLLVSYLKRGFTRIDSFGSWELFRREGEGKGA